MPHPVRRPLAPRPRAGAARRAAIPGRKGGPAATEARATAALALAALLGACNSGDDPFRPRASNVTTLDTLVVHPFGGAQPLLPSALDLLGRRAVRPGVVAGSVNFDLALDRDRAGNVVLLPARTLAIPPSLDASTGSPRTGFQVVPTGFDVLESAPRNGYVPDSVLTVRVGQTIAVEGQGITAGQLTCPTNRALYAKLVVDSVAAATGALHLRVRTNPNCGFRSLRPGLPTD